MQALRIRHFLCCLTFAFVALGDVAAAGQGPARLAGAPYVGGALSAVGRVTRPQSIGEAYGSTLWPKVNGVATVFYVIDPASDPNATPRIQTAINTFNADFPGVLSWVKWNSADGPNYVDINLSAADTSGVCEALEGYEAIPAQRMWGSTACTPGTILHEMGHVIGLWHEQTRYDAAAYITVNYANVIKGSWSNFQPEFDNFQLLTPYDYASLMQYPAFAFSRNGGPVIATIPAGIPLSSSDGVPATATANYSAADKEGILRLYGAAPKNVTVTSNPVGLKVSVDGSTFTTPKTFAWALNSNHTLNVPTGVQTVKGDIAGSSTLATFYYTYGRWNDSTLRSHTITVTPGNGELPFPASSPQVATYSANFSQLVPYAAAIYPAGSGAVTVSPLPKAYSGAGGTFFVARQPITLTAAAKAPWNFYEFNNAPYWLPGGLGANPKSLYVPDTGNPVNTTAEFSNKPIYSVNVTPNSPTSGLAIYTDGNFAYAPKNFSSYYDAAWTAGSQHTLSFFSPEYPYSSNSRYAFVGWSSAAAARPATLRGVSMRTVSSRQVPQTVTARGSGGRTGAGLLRPSTTGTQTVTLPASSETYIATLAPQFAPATNFNPPSARCHESPGSAALAPASPTNDGFYPSGQRLSFAATPSKGWAFAGWTYDLTGSANPATLVATDETLVFANFNTSPTLLTLTSLSPEYARSGSAGFTLTLNGTGFNAGSLVLSNGTYPTVTHVSSTQLKIPVTAAEVAKAGAFQVAVENFPKGWTGCAVFGYQPFFVAGP